MGAQADKATVQLAVNSGDPNIRALMLRLLEELQSEVDECHASKAGQRMLRRAEEKRALREQQAPGNRSIKREDRSPERDEAELLQERSVNPVDDNDA